MNKIINLMFLVVTLFSFTSSASLITDEVFLSCSQSSGVDEANCEGNGLMSSIVGDGIEYPDYFNFQNSLSIDISANSIWVTFDNGPFCGWFTCDGQGFLSFVLSDLDWVDMPTGFITGINVNTNMTGVQTDFAQHSVSFSLPETSVTNTMFLHIDLITDHTDVPEPSTLAIFALGMIGLASRRFKKQS